MSKSPDPPVTPQALSPFRVIDLTHYVAGPYCTKLLAGFGAEVIKVERPDTGDGMRDVPPFVHSQAGLERGIRFHYLNTGKKSVTLDLRTDADREKLKSLIQGADVLVENFAPQVMSRLGLGYETLRAINPQLVMASLSNFGQSGPYRDYLADEIELYAMSGAMYVTGEPDKAPLAPGVAICQYTAGLRAYVAILLALFQRERSGEGQHVDVSIFEGMLDHIENRLSNYLERGTVSKRGAHTFAPWGLYPCRDGYVAVIGAPFRHWNQGAEMFEEPRLLDKKYWHARDRVQHRHEIDALLQPWLEKHDKKDICDQAFQRQLAFGYLSTFEEVLNSPQLAARGFWDDIEHPVIGSRVYCGGPFQMSLTPWRSGRAPMLGEHNDDVLGVSPSELPIDPQPTPAGRGSSPVLPLEGVCVVDLTHSWAGPHCTRILADFGADVILAEYPTRLSMFRGGKTEGEAYNQQPAWHQVNRNKYSITLDVSHDSDRSILVDLVRQADVLVENSRSGVLGRWGFDYDDLCQVKPDLIMISMAGYGTTGPLAGRPAYGGGLEVMSGIQNLTAYSEGQKLHRIREMDVVNGVGGACAVLTALVYRQRTGTGQYIDFSQMELPIHTLLGEHLLEHAMNGSHCPALGNRHRRLAPQGCYRCQGEDRWVTLTVQSEAQWGRFCEAVGQPDWKADPRFASNADRVANHDELDRLIEAWTSRQTHHEVMRRLQSHRVAAGAVLDSADLAGDVHLQERDYFQSVAGTAKPCMGMPFRFSGAAADVRWIGPNLGQHNEQIVCRKLGRSEDQIRPLDEQSLGTAYDPA